MSIDVIVAGALAGIATDGCMHPMDTTRVRLQAERGVDGHFRYRGLTHCLTSTLSREGLRGLYRGFGAVFVMTAPAQAAFFTMYEGMKGLLDRQLGVTGAPAHFISGMCAEVTALSFWVPQDVVKSRVQVQETGTSGSFRMFQHVWRTEGLRGMYRGWSAGLLVAFPFGGTYLLTYEHTKRALGAVQARFSASDSNSSSSSTVGVVGIRSSELNAEDGGTVADIVATANVGAASSTIAAATTPEVGFPVQILSGFFAGGVAAGLTNPMDIVRTRLQVLGRRSDGAYRNIADAVVQMVRREGWTVFLRGMTARVTWLAPSAAISMVTYEQCLRLHRRLFAPAETAV